MKKRNYRIMKTALIIISFYQMFCIKHLYGQEIKVEKKYWDNKMLKQETEYFNDKRKKETFYFYDVPLKREELHYKSNEILDSVIGWYKNGNIRYQYKIHKSDTIHKFSNEYNAYVDSVVVERTGKFFYENGIIRSEIIKDSNGTYKRRAFDLNGNQIKEE